MVGKEYLNKFHPKPSFVRRQVGYIALLIGCVVAKIVVRGKWHLPKKKRFYKVSFWLRSSTYFLNCLSVKLRLSTVLHACKTVA